MQLTKQQTALHIQGASQEFWHALAAYASDCYDAVADAYDSIQDDIENNNIDEGTDLNDETVNIGDYPVRQRPPVRPVY